MTVLPLPQAAGASAGAWQGFLVFSWRVTLRLTQWCSPGRAGVVAISPNVPGRGRERRLLRVALRCSRRPVFGLIGPVIWSSREAV
jgi:hypothetical protein